MKKTLLSLIFIFCAAYFQSQTLSISGTVMDTTAKGPLPNALSMAIRLNDSTLIQYSRSDKNGIFKLEAIPIDTYIVVVSHPQFADQTFIVVGSDKQKFLDFGKIVLPPKTNMLNEVVVFGYRDKVYYKGDTLTYTADSFKVKANATVEDLLRRLPGVKVDAAGKITVQGKEVSQVLVDGDEFFGSDPTVATRNLAANNVESVQVYEKKAETTDSKDETVKVMNLKLKDEAKKGYFGKISGAGGTTAEFNKKFYEGELLANRFNNKRKYSVFALGANSPRNRFNWGDVFQYGLDNEMDRQMDDDGNTTWYTDDSRQNGIPQTLKTGFYFGDKIFKKTKLNIDYTYGQNSLKTKSSTNTQYFLADTTYRNAQTDSSNQSNTSHNVNAKITQTLDSLTDLIITPKLKYGVMDVSSIQTNDFIRADDTLARQSTITNKNSGVSYEASSDFRIKKRFKKKDRFLTVNYYFNTKSDDYTAYLLSENNTLKPVSTFSVIDQKKTNTSNRNEHQAGIVYTEPITKKIKLEFSYDFTYNRSLQDKRTKDYNGSAYDIENATLTNNFLNTRQVQRSGAKFIFEVKKYRFTLGSRVRQVVIATDNLTLDKKLSQTFYNVLPVASFRYSFSQNSRVSIDYTSSSQQPELNQLQPVIDNTNPNRITIGNPALKPTFTNGINVNLNSWKPISNRGYWFGGYFNNTYNSIIYTTSYDNLMVATSQPVNIYKGNYNFGCWSGMNIPFLKNLFTLEPRFNSNYYNNVSYINNIKANTSQLSLTPELDVSFRADKLSFSIGGNYNYYRPFSTISNQSNQPYSTYELTGDIEYKFPKKFTVSTEGTYTDNSKRTNGYNISYFIWNAEINKMFLKNDNLIFALNAYDILNQNISTRRSVMDNRIIDYKGQIIKQYFLLKVTYKFTSTKEKQEENDF